MNVVFVCEGYNSQSVIAQPWRHVYEIASRMKKLGHTVKILTDQVHNLPRDEVIGDISVRRIKKRLLFFDFKELLENINDEHVDVINWYGGPLSTVYFWRMQNSLQKDIVWTMYKGGLTIEDIKNMKVSELLSLFNNILYLYSLCPTFIIRKGANSPKIKKIVVWSKRVNKYLQNIGVSKEKITLIPSGVSAETFKPLVTSQPSNRKQLLGFDENDSILLYFGPLSSLRGFDVLISAMPKITEKLPNVKLLVLAREFEKNGKMSKRLEMAQNSDTIRIISGIQSPSSIVDYLALSTLVVLPFKSWAHQECPLTILEAMAMEKPVVTTQMGAIPEIVKDGETGFLVPPGDADALSQKIIEVLKDETLAENVGRNARKQIEKTYDWNIISEQTLAILNNSSA